MSLHIYRARDQPATHFRIDMSIIDKDGKLVPDFIVVRNPNRRVFRCFKCRKKHYAENMIVHVYYDSTRYFCAPGKGCTAKAKS